MPEKSPYRPWLHCWAILTALAVFPLILSGGTVTSLRAGMADPEWPTPPWYLLVTSWVQTALERGRNFLIEHGHRQIGWIVGGMAVILAAWLWRAESRRSMRWLGLTALAAVGLQGLLGGLRVRLDALAGNELAMIHGFTGQLVFALLAALALFTSRSWLEGQPVALEDPGRIRRLAGTTSFLLLLQLGLGVWLRQQGRAIEAHIIIAIAILTHVFMLNLRLRSAAAPGMGLLCRPARIMAGLVILQAGLGLWAWLAGAGMGAMDHRPVTADRAILGTAHVGVGALLLAASILMTLRTQHHLPPGSRPLVAAVTPSGGTA